MRRLAAATFLLIAAGATVPAAGPGPAEWVTVDYGALVDREVPTHSGESVGALLDRLGGRGRPRAGERREDDVAYRLLEPILEPFAYVLADAVDSMEPPPAAPMIEVAGLWTPGDAEPAWVELLRARRYVVESDGRGRMRVFLPWPDGEVPGAGDGPIGRAPVEAAREAWSGAWPVIRLALAAERRRLARPGAAAPAIDVEVRAYRHRLARSTFDLGITPWRTRIVSTESTGKFPFDLGLLSGILARHVRIEGARLESDGSIRWFVSDAADAPQLLERPVMLADAAVAYRAVFHGGLADPYMSLDRGRTPWIAAVNFGGRLRDTSIGLVSLSCDVRFKTISLGLDPFTGADVRERLRSASDGFRSHLDRFAADPASTSVLGQQTRFWFYPDGVDLTLSPEGDLFAIRRNRMTAASERVDAAASAPGAPRDPAWTRDTVAFVNQRFEALARVYPELAALDESARLLATFAWLRAARDGGLAIPDLDRLLDVELPAEPTPRRFPHLLTHDTLPPPGSASAVDVLDASRVGEGLERLQPQGHRPLPLMRRFRRAQAALDPRLSDHAALLADMDKALTSDTPAETRAALAFRAERLEMHRLVLQTAPEPTRAAIERRREAGEAVRVFSVGIGGIDLGMNAAVERAARRSVGLTDPAAPPPSTTPAPPGSPAPPRSAPTAVAPGSEGADVAPSVPGPGPKMPDHGLNDDADEVHYGDHFVRRGVAGAKADIRWTLIVYGASSPEVKSRRRVQEPDGGTPVFERVEDGRGVSYRLQSEGDVLRARPAISAFPLVAPQSAPAPPDAERAALPEGLATLEVVRVGERNLNLDGPEQDSLRLRVRGPGARDVAADLPRAAARRLVLGRELDTAPERPLPALGAAQTVLGGARSLLVMLDPEQARVPWMGPALYVSGEEDAAHIARALRLWWSGPSGAAAVAAGTDRDASPRRWASAPRPSGPPAIVADATAFPGARSSWRGKALAAVAASAESPRPVRGDLALLVSAEAPGVLGARLAAVARDPAMKGKLLAVAALSSEIRADLPAALLAEGNLAAIGVFTTGPVGIDRALSEIGSFAGAAGKAGGAVRIEEIPGPFLWFY